MKKIITILFMLSGMNLFSQTIYYVKPTGNDFNSGTSWSTAFRTVQKALSAISTGQIWVAAGTYYPDEMGLTNTNDRNATFYLKNNVALYGGFAGTETQLSQREWDFHATILSGDIDQLEGYEGNSLHVVRGASIDGTAILDGFTITGGNADVGSDFPGATGGGMFNYAYASPTILHCTFTGNKAAFRGAAIYNFYYSSPTVILCTFSDNSANEGGGAIYSQTSEASFIQCTFSGNYAYYGGAVYNLSSATTTADCLFWHNSAVSGGAIYNWGYYSGASPTIVNCSFSANTASWGGGISGKYCSPAITNCILWGNSSSIENDYPYSLSPTVSYSLVQGGFPGTGNISSDPLFVNTTGNLRLQGCSPAIDAGHIAALPSTVATDLDGNPRYLSGEVDMGAYEFQPDGQPSIIYVNNSAPGNIQDGSSWATAFTRLQDAIDKAATEKCALLQIWVAKGTYYPTDISTERTASFILRNNAAIYGGFEGTESYFGLLPRRMNISTLSGDINRDGTLAGNSFHVVQATDVDNSAVLDGFIITGGNADGSADPQDRGGGMYNERSYPTVTNCIIRGNRALNYGGGIFNSNSDHPPILTNCLLNGNTSDYAGGAIYNIASSPRIINCTIAGNIAVGSGGGVYNISSSYPTITNSILWGNSNSITNVLGGNPIVTYSLVQGGYLGGSNIIDEDPLFINADTGNLRLQSNSPAIDAGNNAAVTTLQDLTGIPRISNGKVDMGAYEYSTGVQGPPSRLVLRCPDDFNLKADPETCQAIDNFTGIHAATTDGGTGLITIIYDPASGSVLPPGGTLVSVIAYDSGNDTASCKFWVSVNDSTPPEIGQLGVSKTVLFPANHKMQDVTVNYTNHENCSLPVTNMISITSNEPEYGTGSGDTGPDWEIIDEHHVRLRAERSGNGTDRIYTLTITATDAAGNTATASTTVTVPHDKSTSVKTTQRIGKKELTNSLTVQAIPNPTSDGFTIITQSSAGQTLTIQVTDNLGRIVERRTGVLPNGTIYLGSHYRPGMYFMEIVQGDSVQTLKLLKQGR